MERIRIFLLGGEDLSDEDCFASRKGSRNCATHGGNYPFEWKRHSDGG